MKKKYVWILSLVILAIISVVAVLVYKEHTKPKYGILLAFDDYCENSWRDGMDLFDEYDVKVTFFVNADHPTDFCYDAKERGHEIGFHTKSHAKMTELTEEEFYEQAIEPIEAFRSEGFVLSSFAYPYGEYEDWMNEELLKYYNTTRGAWYYRGYSMDGIQGSFVESMSIDNVNFESDEQFEAEITAHLEDLVACEEDTVVSLYSHAISGGDWCVTEERLEYIFKEAERLGIEFYTFKELQNFDSE